MKKTYDFEYGFCDADVTFEVDTKIFTKEHANDTLQFFSWDYDKKADPIDEVMKKYALTAIKEATIGNLNTMGVISKFDNMEGFMKVDGSSGIELIVVSGYEFDEDDLILIKEESTPTIKHHVWTKGSQGC